MESGGQEEFHMRGGKRKMEASNGNKLDKAIAIVVKQDRLWRNDEFSFLFNEFKEYVGH